MLRLCVEYIQIQIYSILIETYVAGNRRTVLLWGEWGHDWFVKQLILRDWSPPLIKLKTENAFIVKNKDEMGGHYHGPEVAPEEFPEQEEEAGGEVACQNKK